MKPLSVIGGIAVAVVLIAAVVLGGWWVGWWFKEQNVERKAHIFRASYANQERLREDAAEKIAEVRSIEVQIADSGAGDPVEQLEAQATAIGSIACRDISQVSELDPELESFAASSCGVAE
jgi:hypothetical protein